jgi:transposase-like protein
VLAQPHRPHRDALHEPPLATRCNHDGRALDPRFRLSAANIRDLLAERGIDVSRQTVLDWVQKFGVLLAEVGRRCAKPLGSRCYVDETYLRVGKGWAYLYRAVD